MVAIDTPIGVKRKGLVLILMPLLPKLAVLLPYAQGVIWIDVDGDIEAITSQDAKQRLDHQAVLCCHRRWCATRLGRAHIDGLDVLELFAFQHPARFVVPTPIGLASFLGLDYSDTAESQAQLLPAIAATLLGQIAETREKQTTAKFARFMAQGGWSWGPMVLDALNMEVSRAPPQVNDAAIWTRLDEIADFTPAPPSGHSAITQAQAQTRLNDMLGRGAETREGQRLYTDSLIPAFTPNSVENPQLVLAEAGTGTGKTIGYLAPATLWTETNTAPVWISTYTKNLQHQIASEITRLYPDSETRDKRVTILKGRENYLCLLNLEEALITAPATPENTIALGLMARWAEASGDGDLYGARFPGWLSDLFDRHLTLGLADKPGECIHSACDHYRKCYVRASHARAQHSDIVITNHALVMINAVKQNLTANLTPNAESQRISHYIFDEGHHLFEVADSTFSTAFTAETTADLRRWIRGNETRQSRSRLRGIRQRIGNLLSDGDTAMQHLEEAMSAAEILPTSGWRQRLTQGTPQGIVEEFFHTARQVIDARTDNPKSPYSLETPLTPLDARLAPFIAPLRDELITLAKPLKRLANCLKDKLEDESANLDSEARRPFEGATRGLMRYASGPLAEWIALLKDIEPSSDTDSGDSDFVDWLEATKRQGGKDIDIGIHRHWIDPSKPFHDHVLRQAKGVIITSATLTDHEDLEIENPDEKAWEIANRLTGASHLDHNPHQASVASPFDYSQQARVFIINDCNRDDTNHQVGGAMAQLMQASGGGALGLFTAIKRLKDVHLGLAAELAKAGLPLYAQHIDDMHRNTLIEIFRAEPNSCLLGTDALRDGIDVPGTPLRLIIFDRVPRPVPNILFKARSQKFGRESWSDRQTRMKLRQAFGRLIRQKTDKGIFIMLDNRLPQKLTSAFPKGTPIIRCGLAEAIKETKEFFS